MKLKDLIKEEGLSSGEKFGLKEVGEEIVKTHKKLNELLCKYMNGLKKYHSKHRKNVGLAKKLEILYPFNIHRKDNIIYFEYRLEYIHRDDVLWKPRVNRMITNPRNKYCDLLLSIEKL